MPEFTKLLSLVGRSEFIPNARVIYKETTHYPPDDRKRFVNPLYGGADRTSVFADELDERGYEKTILRHSSYFDITRKIRRNVRMSGPYILGETEVRDIPDYNERRIVCEAMYCFEKKEGKYHKWILIPEEGIFEICTDGTLRLLGTDLIIPQINLESGRQTCSTVSPITDGFTHYGENGNRMCRMFSTENFTDSLGSSGGHLFFEYSSRNSGAEIERVRTDIDVFPMEE